MITLVACLDMDNAIANEDGELLYKIKNDLKHFKEFTTGKIVVMGRKTWETLPKKPLPERKNYILTRNEKLLVSGAKIINDIDKIKKLAMSYDVCVIGGEDIYNQTIAFADKMVLTHVHEVHKNGAYFFPNFNSEKWKVEKIEKVESCDSEIGISYSFVTYTKKN